MNMGRRCVWEAPLVRHCAGAAAEGAALRERRRLDFGRYHWVDTKQT